MFRFFTAFALSFVCSIPGVVIFVLLWWLGLWEGTIPVLMYRGLVLACLAIGCHGLLVWAFLKGRRDRECVVVSAISLAFAANVIFLVVFPVTIDRSVTVYLLGQLSRHPAGMTEGELNERVVAQYVDEYRAVNRRMEEQMFTGNVRRESDRYYLTSQGDRFIGFSRLVARVFGLDPKYVQASEPVVSK